MVLARLMNTIWSKYEDLCKPQANEVCTKFDLLTSFCQGNRSVDERYNAVKAQVCLARYAQETENILHHDIFWFFLKDEEFVSTTSMTIVLILISSLQARLSSLQEDEMEAPKATAWHIKQVATDPQGA